MNIETDRTKGTSITTNTFAAGNGNMVILIFSMDPLEMMDAANKQHPTGGVTKPVIRYHRDDRHPAPAMALEKIQRVVFVLDLPAEPTLLIDVNPKNKFFDAHANMEVVQIRFTWLMRAYHYKPHFVMIKIPAIIEAVEQRDGTALERMLVEHVEYFVDRLR